MGGKLAKNFIVTNYTPSQRLIRSAGIIIVLAIIIWSLLNPVYWMQLRNHANNYALNKERLVAIETLQEENGKLKKEIKNLENFLKFDQATAVELQAIIKELQEDRHNLQQELEFYQGIINSKEEDLKGLRIQDLGVSKITGQQYQFRLILTHIGNSRKQQIRGKLEIIFEGQQDDVPKTLPITELIQDNNFQQEIIFNNFKQISGNIKIPVAFEPRRITVQISLKNKGKQVFKKTFPWAPII